MRKKRCKKESFKTSFNVIKGIVAKQIGNDKWSGEKNAMSWKFHYSPGCCGRLAVAVKWK